MTSLCSPDFNFEAACKCAGRIAWLCEWVSAMVAYHNITKLVMPKIEVLQRAEKSAEVAKKLTAVMDDLAACNDELDAMTVSDLL